MIEINLLPEEMRKKPSSLFAKLNLSSFSIQKIPVLPIAAGIAGLLIFVQIAVSVMSLYTKLSFVSLNKRYEMLAPKKREADALKSQNDVIARRMSAIDELMGKRFSWSKKLNSLSDAMTPGIWLSLLEYNERSSAPAAGAKAKSSGMSGMLILNGYVAGSQELTALVGSFITSLKDNEGFYSDFREINLVATKSDRVEAQEVMNFKIGCVFK